MLLQQSLTKIHIVDDIFELSRVNPHHHVHCSRTLNRLDASDALKTRKSSLRCRFQLPSQINEELLRNLTENLGQRSLHQRVRMQEDHRVLAHIINHFVEIAAIVVDNGPPTSPPGHTVDLTDRACADDWHLGLQRAHRVKRLIIVVAEAVVDLV